MRPCPEYADDIVLLALGDPELEDRDRLEEHLRTCTACRTYLADVRAALAGLGEPPPALKPPAALKGRVLAAYRRERGSQADGSAPAAAQGSASEPRSTRVAAPVAGPAPVPVPAGSRPPAADVLPGTLRRWLAAGLAAAVLLLAVNVTLGVAVWRMRSEVDALTRMIELNGSQLMVAYDLMSLLQVPAERTVELQGEPPAPGAFGRASVYTTGSGTLVVVTAWDLPSLPAETAVYQVWLVRDGERVNAGVFRTDPRGNGVVIYRHPGELEFDAVGITVEPDPYGDAPRGHRVLVGLLNG
ncbi:MAG TPA: anti-sigma factor [Bacillota bacterium]